MRIASLLLLILISSHGLAGTHGIYGGTSDQRNQWGSVIAISNFFTGVFCSGVVIAPNMVLTAAHCLSDDSALAAMTGKIMLGTGGPQGWESKIKVAAILAHPNFKPNTEKINLHDFGIILLKTPVPPSVKIIPLLNDQEAKIFFSGTPFITEVGYGVRENGISGEKFVTTTQITKIYESEFLAGLDDGKGICNGDSGGPAFAEISPGNWRVVGIASRGESHIGTCGSRVQIFGRADTAKHFIQNIKVRSH